uniref:Uncharacterized protein n=1 Tax=Trypanosoma congolense (strain IL3000) TaxID=1068625 RepID=G0V090_TRYCI|nr:hypothetical protein, unlikely [Trypanosoma congolense IL3000]
MILLTFTLEFFYSTLLFLKVFAAFFVPRIFHSPCLSHDFIKPVALLYPVGACIFFCALCCPTFLPASFVHHQLLEGRERKKKTREEGKQHLFFFLSRKWLRSSFLLKRDRDQGNFLVLGS